MGVNLYKIGPINFMGGGGGRMRCGCGVRFVWYAFHNQKMHFYLIV